MDAKRRSAEQFSAAMNHHRAGRLDEAERLYRLVCATDMRNARAFHLLGVVAHQLGRADAAELLGRAVAIEPGLAEAHNDHGVILAARGEFGDASVSFERAVALKPDYVEARNNFAQALRALGRLDEAVAQFEHALKGAPDSPIAHFNLAVLLRELGRLGEALAYAERAVALWPDAAGPRSNLGNILRELGRLDEAIAQYDRALASDPNLAAAHYNRGMALRGQSRIAQAKASFERALALKPDFLEAELALCMAELPILYREDSEIIERRAAYGERLAKLSAAVERVSASATLADAVGSHQPFYLAYQGRNDRDLQASYGDLVVRIMAAAFPASPLPPLPAADEPIRLGVVSGFFRRHSNWKIPIKGWLRELDCKRFRVFAYHTGAKRDAETEAAAALCDRFVQGPLALDSWRRTILQDAPHVLLYPEIGMDKATAQLAAQRLARVQCVSWGHPVTSGFPTIDYFISSDLMEPSDGQSHYSERLVRLPNLSIYYEPPAVRPIALDRAALGLRPSAVVYWCCQSLPKYLPQFDEVFARIARDVGDCQFTFIEFAGGNYVTDVFRTRLDRAFSAVGLRSTDHCVILPRLEPDQFIAAIGQCDILLDSIGWSGCNSTLESLAHNLPIVAFSGELMRGRHTAAMLELMDASETIARTVGEYVSIAVGLGRNAAERTAVSGRVKANKHRVYRDRRCIAALEDFLDRAARNEACTDASAARSA